VFSSEHGDLHSLLERYEAGFYFDISDPVQLANKILDMSNLDSQSYKKISDNCKSLFRDHLQADVIYRKYADHVEHIAHKYSCRGKGLFLHAMPFDQHQSSVSL
jgi:glycosyltransferase involved in cell wall biosynthesis